MISEGEETTVKIVAGMLRLKSINQAEDSDSMTGQKESEQAQIREDRQDSRGRGRQMSNFEPDAESTPFEKTGKGLLEISERATELLDEKREAAETTGTRSGRKYKETYKRAKIMPLLVEGTELKYVPWGGST